MFFANLCSLTSISSDQIFPDSVKRTFNLPDSFGEHHCRLAFKHIHDWRCGEKVDYQVDMVQGWFNLPYPHRAIHGLIICWKALMVLSATDRRLAKSVSATESYFFFTDLLTRWAGVSMLNY